MTKFLDLTFYCDFITRETRSLLHNVSLPQW